MHERFPIIDYEKIVAAKKFYGSRGYEEMEVPWIIGHDAYSATRPTDREDFYTNGGYLNASGEQSFIHLMLQGVEIGKNMCITPCFRKEPILDDIHHLYFMKLELIDTDVSLENMHQMIAGAKEFFERYFGPGNIEVLQTDTHGHSFDLIEKHTGIELGSYGIRTYGNLKWMYGTGIALPRFDTVLNKLLKK